MNVYRIDIITTVCVAPRVEHDLPDNLKLRPLIPCGEKQMAGFLRFTELSEQLFLLLLHVIEIFKANKFH